MLQTHGRPAGPSECLLLQTVLGSCKQIRDLPSECGAVLWESRRRPHGTAFSIRTLVWAPCQPTEPPARAKRAGQGRLTALSVLGCRTDAHVNLQKLPLAGSQQPNPTVFPKEMTLSLVFSFVILHCLQENKLHTDSSNLATTLYVLLPMCTLPGARELGTWRPR